MASCYPQQPKPRTLVLKAQVSGQPWFLLLFFILFLAGTAFAQEWSGVLKPVGSSKYIEGAGIDWSNAGVGGIPARTTICTTVQASACGSSDCTSTIQSALNSCSSGQTVLLGPGTFQVATSVRVPSDVTLRGAGPDQTVINSTGSASKTGVVNMGSGDPANPTGNSVNITSGATAGSTSIVVSNASNFAVGRLIHITETNDPQFVTNVGGSDNCTYCDGFWNGTRVRGQIVEIKSVSGTTIGFDPPLYTAYTLSPQALPFAPSAKFSGLENLQIKQNGTHSNSNETETVLLSNCAYCWVKGIEVNYTDGDFVKVYWGFRDEIRDNYFSNAYPHGPGQNNQAVLLAFKTSATLVENNIFERAQTPVMLEWGPAGNVIAYNYMTGTFSQSPPSVTDPAFEPHAAHPQFNLFEGNVGAQEWLDSGHGSSSHGTSFRNWLLGTNFVCSPTNGTRGTVNCSGGKWSTDAARAVMVDSLSTYYNFVGDVLGSSAQNALTSNRVAMVRWPSNRGYNGVVYGFTFGYTLLSDSGGNSKDNTDPYDTVFIHGVYNNIDGSTTWDSGTSHSLPASFYLSGKPAWWGSVPWPATGPDVTGGIGPGGHANLNPAAVCFYNVMNGVDGGEGSPLTFNASRCYTTGGQSSVDPPSNLKATVQ